MELEKHRGRIVVIKLGGSTLGNHDTTLEDLVTLQNSGMIPVVVHGGGKEVTEWLKKLSIPTNFYNGLRVTDAKTLEVVTAILAGLVNKELTASIQALGGKAIGLSGIDGNLLQAKGKGKEIGYVGEVEKVDPEMLNIVIEAGYMPVIAPLSIQSYGKKAENNYILNTNGDTAAGEIAAAISAWKLIFLTDVAGVGDSKGELISELSPLEAVSLIESGTISGGMIPKIKACLDALSTVTLTRIIDGRKPHVLIEELKGRAKGTTIKQK